MITIDYHNNILPHWNRRHFKEVEEFEDYFLQRLRETTSDAIEYTNKERKVYTLTRIDNFPELKLYEVWSEGYSATGDNAKASLIGKTYARNFRQACDIVMCTRHLEHIQNAIMPDNTAYFDNHSWSYDPHELKDWGCRLYWSESLARKTFG